MAAALKAGLNEDFIAVIRGQGPRANGMPELHKLIPAMSGLLAKGRRVAIVTDGRMSGASGKVPAAIHLTPEAAADGPISQLRDGDIIRLDARAGVLEAQVDAATLQARESVKPEVFDTTYGVGRELFTRLREGASAGGRGRVDPVDAVGDTSKRGVHVRQLPTAARPCRSPGEGNAAIRRDCRQHARHACEVRA